MFDVFIGYDSREPVAYHVLAHSIQRHSAIPVRITPLARHQLTGLHERKDVRASTEFSLTRFLVPFLCDYRGRAVFLDCDMLVRENIAELFGYGLMQPDAAVCVAQHDYVPHSDSKFLGQKNEAYPRKNWSSVMVFNNEKCRALTPSYVDSASPADLHRLVWAGDAIGRLPLEWNWLVGEYAPNPAARNFHWTLGGPWFAEFVGVDHAGLWMEEFYQMTAPLYTESAEPRPPARQPLQHESV